MTPPDPVTVIFASFLRTVETHTTPTGYFSIMAAFDAYQEIARSERHKLEMDSSQRQESTARNLRRGKPLTVSEALRDMDEHRGSRS